MVVAIFRIILQTLLLLEIFLYNVLENSSYELLYALLEVLDYGKLFETTVFSKHFLISLFLNFLVVLIVSLASVWSLFQQLKHRDQNTFTRLQNDV